MPEAPSVCVPPNAGAGALVQKHGEAGLSIGARTGVPGWGGERADYTYMLTMLEQRERRQSD